MEADQRREGVAVGRTRPARGVAGAPTQQVGRSSNRARHWQSARIAVHPCASGSDCGNAISDLPFDEARKSGRSRAIQLPWHEVDNPTHAQRRFRSRTNLLSQIVRQAIMRNDERSGLETRMRNRLCWRHCWSSGGCRGCPSPRPSPLEPLSMRFEWVQEGPAEPAATTAAHGSPPAGPITADTAPGLSSFSARRAICSGATMVLDSGGGSVLASLELGRQVRELGMKTTVGRVRQRSRSAARSSARRCRRAANAPRCASSCCSAACTARCRRKRGSWSIRSGRAASATMPARRITPPRNWSASSAMSGRIATLHRRDGRRYRTVRARHAHPAVGAAALAYAGGTAPHAPADARDGARTYRPPARSTLDPCRQASSVRPTPERGWMFVEQGRADVLTRRHRMTVEGDEIGQLRAGAAVRRGDGRFRVAYPEARALAIAVLPRADRRDVCAWAADGPSLERRVLQAATLASRRPLATAAALRRRSAS